MGFCVAGEHGVVGRILPMTSSVPCIAALIWYHTMTLSDKTQWYRVVKLLSSVRDLSEMIYDIVSMLNSMVVFGRFRDHLHKIVVLKKRNHVIFHGNFSCYIKS